MPQRITVQSGLLSQIGQKLRDIVQGNSGDGSPPGIAAIVSDSNVGPIYVDAIQRSLEAAAFRTIVSIVPAGEHHKTLSAAEHLYDTLLARRIDRSASVIAVGGGMVTDLAGFVAGTILRGVRLVNVPTSLLAMVDAAVGGKTGVNHRLGKNLIGVFHEASDVLIDPATLRTLPDPELVQGFAECLKHALIADATLFADLPSLFKSVRAGDPDAQSELVHRNVQIKLAFVQRDPTETGDVRAHLNLGHTFAHAIETASSHAINHGNAVALGLCAAADLSRELRLISHAEVDAIIGAVESSGLPTKGLGCHPDSVLDAMQRDKKSVHGRLRFVLLSAIGKSVLRDDVAPESVRLVLQRLG